MTLIHFGYCVICKCGQYFEQVVNGWRCPRCHNVIPDTPEPHPEPCAICQIRKETEHETQK